MNFPAQFPDDVLAPVRQRASARHTPRTVGWPSRLIGGGVIALFAALFAMTFFRDSLFAWSVGLVYVFYDTCLLAFTWSKVWQLDKAQSARVAGPVPTLAVLIAAHNEERAIAVTIDALLSQTSPPDLILIADDGSSDGTGDVLMGRYGLEQPALGRMSDPAARNPSVRWLRMPHGGKPRTLNAALVEVHQDIVVTVDADTLIEQHAMEAMRGAFACDSRLMAATGVLTPVCGTGWRARFFEWFQTYEYVRNFLSRHAWAQLNGLLLISGAFAAFRREAVVTVGGFDPDCLVEDYELIHRLHRWSGEHGLDWTVSVIGAARARTDAPETLMSFLRQRRRWFAGFLETQRWNRDMVGDVTFGKLGTRMLPVKALDTMQPLYGLVAFALLIGFVVAGKTAIALPIVFVMLAKIVIDLSFHLWSLSRYQRWTGDMQSAGLGKALIASLLEPFTFQLLRHAGAAWGWWTFLTTRSARKRNSDSASKPSWGRQNRRGIAAQATPDDRA
jgi:cellulose synthase/poly-beta-1,6-N-acetylglucosamine synthase-like glycosyltransferase